LAIKVCHAARQSHIAYRTLTVCCAQCVPTCVLPVALPATCHPRDFRGPFESAVEVKAPLQLRVESLHLWQSTHTPYCAARPELSLEPLLGGLTSSREDCPTPIAKTKRRRKLDTAVLVARIAFPTEAPVWRQPRTLRHPRLL
jgi:hypothetical protein